MTRGLYERDQELTHAEESIRGVCRRFESGGTELGDLLLYNGRAGSGKTSLLAEVRRSAGQHGCTVLFARGAEQQGTVPFGVIRQLLQPPLARLTDQERRELFGNWYDVAAPAVGMAPPSTQMPSDPTGVLDGLDWVVTQLAVRNAPLTLIVDDLHWADAESLRWLDSFLVRIRELPALVVLAYRPEELADAPEPAVHLVDGHLTRPIPLRDLSPDAVAALARRELADSVGAPDDAFCREVWAVTAGNPYEVVELLAKVRDRGIAPVEDSAPRLRDLVASGKGPALIRRLEKFGPAAFRFAWAAAVLGTEIDPQLCANIAALGPADAAAAIDQLREERILSGGRTLEFVHPTIATTVYQAIPPATRTGMHGIAAQAVLDAGKGVAAASRHLLEVHPDDDLELVRQLREAAAEHLAVGAPEAARRCLERALAEPPAPEDRAGVLYELGCATLLTNPPVTVNHLRAALAATPGLDQERRVYATQRLAQALSHTNQLGEAARVVAEEADRTPPGPQRMRLLAAHAMWRVFSGDEDDARERSRRLAELARGRTGRDAWERAVMAMRAWDLTLRGEHTTEALAHAELGLQDGRPAPGIGWSNDFWGFEIPTVLGFSYIYNDRLDIASELFNGAAAEFELLGWSGAHLAFATMSQGLVARRWGHLRAAEQLLREALRKSDRLGRGTPLQWDTVGLLIDTCWPGARPRPRWRSPRSTSSGRRTRRPWCCRTRPPCTAACCCSATGPRRPPRSSSRRVSGWTPAGSTTPSGRPGRATWRGPSASSSRTGRGR
nr:ATP-binding protein [Phaeacidiphilus oryzae]